MKLELKYSSQAQRVIKNLKDFDREEFGQWYLNNKLCVGGGDVVQYIELKEINKEGK